MYVVRLQAAAAVLLVYRVWVCPAKPPAPHLWTQGPFQTPPHQVTAPISPQNSFCNTYCMLTQHFFCHPFMSLLLPISNHFQTYGCFSMYMFVCTFRNPPLSKACCFFPVTALVMLSAPASDDEGSTAATDGSTLRTSPAEHGGSVGSESGGSAVDSVAGEHNGKT